MCTLLYIIMKNLMLEKKVLYLLKGYEGLEEEFIGGNYG
jgi:hypothetical protein